MGNDLGEAVVTWISIATALVALAGAVRAWLKARASDKAADAKVAEAQAAAAEAQRELAETLQQQQLARPSLPPDASWPGETPWSVALNELRQRFEGLIREVASDVRCLDEKHDQTCMKLARLEGRMNGHSKE